MSGKAPSTPPPAWHDHLHGLLLFLFIPAVLFLFVRHPEPIILSLISGVVLMIGHRRIARPYMLRVAPRICVWSHRRLCAADNTKLELEQRGQRQLAYVMPQHAASARRFFRFVYRFRGFLAPAIFGPLLMLLGSLFGSALGWLSGPTLATVTAAFQLIIGVTVNIAAWGFLLISDQDGPLPVPFPLHNFFLLGISKLLWIFRLLGLAWIVMGARGLLS